MPNQQIAQPRTPIQKFGDTLWWVVNNPIANARARRLTEDEKSRGLKSGTVGKLPKPYLHVNEFKGRPLATIPGSPAPYNQPIPGSTDNVPALLRRSVVQPDASATRAKIEILTLSGENTPVAKPFSDFILIGYQGNDAEKAEVVETFGLPLVVTSGRFMRQYTFQCAARSCPVNAQSNKGTAYRVGQYQSFLHFYDQYLRISAQAKTGRMTRLTVDGELFDGWVVSMTPSRSADSEDFVSFSFTMLVRDRTNPAMADMLGTHLKRFAVANKKAVLDRATMKQEVAAAVGIFTAKLTPVGTAEFKAADQRIKIADLEVVPVDTTKTLPTVPVQVSVSGAQGFTAEFDLDGQAVSSGALKTNQVYAVYVNAEHSTLTEKSYTLTVHARGGQVTPASAVSTITVGEPAMITVTGVTIDGAKTRLAVASAEVGATQKDFAVVFNLATKVAGGPVAVIAKSDTFGALLGAVPKAKPDQSAHTELLALTVAVDGSSISGTLRVNLTGLHGEYGADTLVTTSDVTLTVGRAKIAVGQLLLHTMLPTLPLVPIVTESSRTVESPTLVRYSVRISSRAPSSVLAATLRASRIAVTTGRRTLVPYAWTGALAGTSTALVTDTVDTTLARGYAIKSSAAITAEPQTTGVQLAIFLEGPMADNVMISSIVLPDGPAIALPSA